MEKPTVDDYLKKGIYGQKEINPEEKRTFLGTFRERIIVALTQSQVREQGTYKEVEELMSRNREAKLYLNGSLDFKYLRDYIQIADQLSIDYLVVSNQEKETDIGLVLAHDHAIDKEDIFIEEHTEKDDLEKDEKGLSAFLNRLFRP
ncbi:YueI family protein [Halalkalibacterium halodurans]|uniref:DUF1694 domain-containing protein n=1 Tax=Halalkalibacterium halodurans TaxID=86665 RepID=A0A0M0KGK9_ALKHA|nr:YueI family protein [Halalkalibacterium halodurans]MED3648759.1 YueI family protein [Halalkalibacterium halodurans]MED4161497.1 YueI family protein [Halalkalibacterium halodurans]TES48602.1 DUF1694 domain-containing protein [Halalkalibacterium halodurans]TPE66534.1 DUF1694 domain-containing protein [Halalkalibacterium halodurans]